MLSFYHIDFEPSPPLLRGTSLRMLTAEELTESAELMLTLARQHQCPYWLLDARRHQAPQPLALHQWMQEEYFPRVRAALGQPASVAFLSAPTFAPHPPALNETVQREWLTPHVCLHWFTDEAAARDWLQAQARAAQAEPPARLPSHPTTAA